MSIVELGALGEFVGALAVVARRPERDPAPAQGAMRPGLLAEASIGVGQ